MDALVLFFSLHRRECYIRVIKNYQILSCLGKAHGLLNYNLREALTPSAFTSIRMRCIRYLVWMQNNLPIHVLIFPLLLYNKASLLPNNYYRQNQIKFG